jgi:hypothetical protein
MKRKRLTSAQRRLVESHAYLVKEMAREMRRRYPRSHHDDLLSACNEGIVLAAFTFDRRLGDFPIHARCRMHAQCQYEDRRRRSMGVLPVRAFRHGNDLCVLTGLDEIPEHRWSHAAASRALGPLDEACLREQARSMGMEVGADDPPVRRRRKPPPFVSSAELSDHDVRRMRRLHAAGMRIPEIAREYPCLAVHTVGFIIRRTRRRDVA